MTTRRAAWVGVLASAAFVLTCLGSSGAAVSHVISVGGTVGPLQLDRSDRAQVIAYAGKPDADLHSRGDASRYEVLGYGCPRHVRPPLDSLINCRTGFYLVRGKLGLFFTLVRKPYSESHGLRIGTPTARAERLLHRRIPLGPHCGPEVELQSKRARLAIFFSGGNSNSYHPGGLLVGGHVDSFYLHSKDRDPGVTDCS